MLIPAIHKEFKLLARDLHGVAVLFVMPILFMFIMSLALSGEDTPSGRIILLGDFPADLAPKLRAQGLEVIADDLAALPHWQAQATNSQLILAQADTPQLYLNPAANRAWLAATLGLLREQELALRVDRFIHRQHIVLNAPLAHSVALQVQANEQLGSILAALAAELRRTPWQEHYLGRDGDEQAKPDAVQHSVPAWLIFGMFFIMIPLSNVMLAERHSNTLTRLRIARAPAWQLLLAKLVPYFLINLLQYAGMIALGIFILPRFGLSALALPGSPLPYLLLAIATSLAALGYGLLMSVLAKSSEQAVVLGGGGILIMAALGGIMVPVHIMPAIMQTIAAFSPMGWALSAFQQLLLNAAPLADIARPLLLLLTFAAITLTLATLRYQRQLHHEAHF